MKISRLTKSISVFLAVCMLVSTAAFTTASAAGKNNFKNYGAAEKYITGKGIMKGDGKGNYAFSDRVTRGDIIVLIVRAMKFTTGKYGSFKDVPSSSYYYDAINTLKHFGIAKGDGTNFYPGRNVTLQEAFLFMERSMKIADGSLIIGDNTTALETLFGTRSLNDYATRDDIAAMLYYILTGKAPDEDAEASASTIKYTTDAKTPVTFDASDFTLAAKNSKPVYVQFSLPSSAYGKLYYKYNTTASEAVTAATSYYIGGTPDLSKVSFVPNASFTGMATVSYKAYDAAGGLLYAAIIQVTVSAVASSSADVIAYQTNSAAAVTFKTSDFTAVSAKLSDDDLAYVIFTPPSSKFGTLTYQYGTTAAVAVTAASLYRVSSAPYIGGVTFSPASGYSGTVTISYSAYNATNDLMYTATVTVTVSTATVSSGVINYTAATGTPANFSAADFTAAVKTLSGGTLSYVKFVQPLSAVGKLYYLYGASGQTGVASTTAYFSGDEPSISDVSFVSGAAYTGTATMAYKAYDSSDQLLCTGMINITVNAVPAADRTITYNLGTDSYVTLNSDDFTAQCQALTGDDLYCVTFTPPASGSGTLYYKYGTSSQATVSPTLKYFVGTAPKISNITFVSPGSLTGTVSFTYQTYNVSGSLLYSGIVNISASSKASTAAAISYSAQSGSYATLRSDDFVRVCATMTNDTLSYVKFALPSTGNLYYQYNTTAVDDVSTVAKYYVGQTPSISYVSFVPNYTYSGTTTFGYQAYNSSGALLFSGSVSVTIGTSSTVSSGVIQYSGTSGAALYFNDNDFITASLYQTSDRLSYVEFTLPSSSLGKLYYKTTSSSLAVVSATQEFYPSVVPTLSSVCFVPTENYSGTLSIAYRAYNASDTFLYTGTIQVTVAAAVEIAPVGAPVTMQTNNNSAVAMPAGDILVSVFTACRKTPAYFKFTPPASSCGTIRFYTTSTTTVGSIVTSALPIYLSGSVSLGNLKFVPAETYTGTAMITYKAYDSSNTLLCTGTINVTVVD